MWADSGTSVLQGVVGKIEGGETWAGVMGQGSGQLLSEITVRVSKTAFIINILYVHVYHSCMCVYPDIYPEVCQYIVLITFFPLNKVRYPHVLSPALSRTNSSSRMERATTRRICSHTSADWRHTGTPDTLFKKNPQKNFLNVDWNKSD